MKTVRFTSLVEACGAPEPHVLWVPAPRDPTFQKALKKHRVLSVHQELVGSKKDHGLVGFSDAPHTQYLIFPKSLHRFDGHRVIGIDYELLDAGEEPRPPSAHAAKTLTPPAHDKAPPRRRKLRTTSDDRDKVVPFRRIEKPARVPKPPAKLAPPPPEPAPPAPAEIERVIDRTLKELKAGKAVAAYDRLLALQQRIRGRTG